MDEELSNSSVANMTLQSNTTSSVVTTASVGPLYTCAVYHLVLFGVVQLVITVVGLIGKFRYCHICAFYRVDNFLSIFCLLSENCLHRPIAVSRDRLPRVILLPRDVILSTDCFSCHTFSVAGPRPWNQLLSNVWLIKSSAATCGLYYNTKENSSLRGSVTLPCSRAALYQSFLHWKWYCAYSTLFFLFRAVTKYVHSLLEYNVTPLFGHLT